MAPFLLQNVTGHMNMKTVLDPMLSQEADLLDVGSEAGTAREAVRSRFPLPEQLMAPTLAAAHPAASVEHP